MLKFVSGFVAGVVLMAGGTFVLAPSLMINEDLSQFDHATTLATLKEKAKASGWAVPAVHRIDKSVAKAGYQVPPVAVVELCNKEHAGQILSNPDNRYIASMMPCRVAIYENAAGDVVLSRMNTALVAQLFGGEIAEVMAKATADTEQILGSVLR